MRILILGSGGREHTFAWKIKQSPLCEKLFVAPGNAGTQSIATNVDLDITNFESIGSFAIENQVGLILVGPELPLVLGIKNYFLANDSIKHISIIGPDKVGAQLEGSKDFSKKFMNKYSIPTAASATFSEAQLKEGLQYLENHSLPIVLKADGLAAGKGVIIANSISEAQETLKDMLSNKRFGAASAQVVIEQYLHGIEVSVFTISDGNNYKILPEAKDYKRIGEGDTGPNTGGMGAVSPVPFADKVFMQKVEQKIIKPTFDGLKEEGIEYCGFIFFGLMNVDGEPWVIEYNARMGDPETEVVIPRLENDFVELLQSVANKNLSNVNIIINEQTATSVMLVAGGYPEDYEKGDIINGVEDVQDCIVFHAGTIISNNNLVTNGGRVLAITSLGNTITEAVKKSNLAADRINYKGKYFRRDIGKDLIDLK